MSEPVERRRLGLGCNALLALLLVATVALVVVGVFALRRVQRTNETRALLWEIRARLVAQGFASRSFPSRMNRGDDPCLVVRFEKMGYAKGYMLMLRSEVEGVGWRELLPLDAWGGEIRYVSPGPAHPDGWDLISSGPNGAYEEGRGDDVVIGIAFGPDAAPIGSAR